jgi:hypothetical protein
VCQAVRCPQQSNSQFGPAHSRNADAGFYRGYLTDNALIVSRFGVLDREQILRQFAGGNVNPFLSTVIEDPRVVVLDDDSALLTYKATIEALITRATTPELREGWTTVFSIYAHRVRSGQRRLAGRLPPADTAVERRFLRSVAGWGRRAAGWAMIGAWRY